MWDPHPQHPLCRLFSGLAEQTFMDKLGLADPPLVDYLSTLLSRFSSVGNLFRLRDADGRRLEEVADMIMDAESLPPEGRTRREVYRHIGDFTLFWTGVFPEATQKRRTPLTKDCFLDYREQGKRSYLIASSFDDEPYREQAAVLRRLAENFELLAFGLHQVRRELDAYQAGGGAGVGIVV